jgi:hypothetical protein
MPPDLASASIEPNDAQQDWLEGRMPLVREEGTVEVKRNRRG